MKYLIFGNKGQLGRHFEIALARTGHEAKGYDIDEIDIAVERAVFDCVAAHNPDIIINCAAYNQVDNAETDSQTAFAANATGPENLAGAAEKYGAKLVHYGTDYVFDGKKTGALYTEKDLPAPPNEYARSKLEGEKLVLMNSPEALVLRVSWVFGPGRQNFIYKVMQWAKNNPFLKVAFDEVSVPTYTGMIVDVSLRAIDAGLSGLYHLTNGGYAPRYEYAKYVIERLAPNKIIHPVSKDIFNLPARRPDFSAMDNSGLSGALDIDIPHWREGIDKYFREFDWGE
jgi:dTDP-4-dehydrorhamnose reductase